MLSLRDTRRKRLHLMGAFLHPCTQGLQIEVLYLLKEVLILSKHRLHRQMIRIYEAMSSVTSSITKKRYSCSDGLTGASASRN